MLDELFDRYDLPGKDYDLDLNLSYLNEEENDDNETTFDEYTDSMVDLDDQYQQDIDDTIYESFKTDTEGMESIEPVTSEHDPLSRDPTTAGLPTDRGTTEAERRQRFQEKYEDQIQAGITMERMIEAAQTLVDAQPTEIQQALAAQQEVEGAGLLQDLRHRAVEVAEDRYVKDHMFYQDRMDDLLADAVEETMDDLLPTHELRDGVRKVYDGNEIDPRAIQRHLVRRMAYDVESTVSEYDEAAQELVEDGRLTAEASPDELENALPGSMTAMESRAGETVMGVRWDSGHPAVQQAAADRFQASIGKDIQRAATGSAEAPQEVLEQLQDDYSTSLERLRVDETLAALEEHWGTSDMPYEIFEIDDPDEMERAASDIGNCRRSATDYYQDLADDPYTTILGVRRDDEDEWIGMARAFHLETPDDEDVFAIDNLGMQYEGDVAGAPQNCCDFEEFGDALPVMGLASIAYGIENDFDYVVAGRDDSRVGGGPGERIGVAQLYSTKNTDESELPVEKKGHRDVERPFGLKKFVDPARDQNFALLMENPSR